MKTFVRLVVATAVVAVSSRLVAAEPLKLLAVGNSFSVCALRETPKVAAAMDLPLDFASIQIGGCSLERHWSNVTNAADLTYSLSWSRCGKISADWPELAACRKPAKHWSYKARKFVDAQGVNICDILRAVKWDVITIQQCSHQSWVKESYHPFGDDLVATIRKLAPSAKIMVQETWSYTPWDARLAKWGIDQDEMYAKLHAAYADFAGKYGFEIIPTGTAVQYYRQRLPVKYTENSFGGDVAGGLGKSESERFRQDKKGKWHPACDVFHFNEDGHYLQALVWTASILKADVTACAYAPKGLAPERAKLMREVAMAAVRGTNVMRDVPEPEIVCEGEYGGHLQGVATDGKSLFWSHTDEVVKTDLDGRILATTGKVAPHQGDLCVKDGTVYVAVNRGRFNQMNAAASEVWAYEAETMRFLRKWSLPDMPHGAGGMTYAGDRFFVIGGLPATIEENYVYEYDADFRLVTRHRLTTGYTFLGIQTAAYEDGRFLFGIYGGPGNPSGVLVCPRDLSSFVRRTGPGNVGIIKLGDEYWTGRVVPGSRPQTHRGALVRSPGYPEACSAYEPTWTGKGGCRIIFEGVSSEGWKDAGYALSANGCRPLSSAKGVYWRQGVTDLRPPVPAVGIGGDRSYSAPDLVRAVRRVAATGESFALHVVGTPESTKNDEKLTAALKAVRNEAKRLGVTLSDRN